GKEYIQKFTTTWCKKKKWLCGSTSRQSFCFPCLLFGGEVAWTQTGANDLKHLSKTIKKHELCKCHLDNLIKMAMFESVNIATQLNKRIRKHNEEVDRNWYVLSKLIDCVQFCGTFDMALYGHDETESSLNPGLVDFVSSIDSAMEKHVKTATVFKSTSKTIQNKLLDCMLDMTREFIIQQLRNTEYMAIQVDNTTDVSTKHQSVLVYWYIDGNGKVVKRFYGFTHLKDSCAESIATALLDQLNIVFSEHCDKQKLIAQSYDGVSVMHEESGGVQRKVRDRYPKAHYVHCYAHQLNLIMEQAVSKISQVRIFFCDLSGFLAFFSHSPKRTEVLDAIVARRLLRGAATCWNFNIWTVNVVYEHRHDRLECFKTIKCSSDFESITIHEARGFIRMLKDIPFLSFFFYDIMPHVDVLYSQLQKVTTEFVSSINKVWESIDDLGSKLPNESEFPILRTKMKTMEQVAQEVRDIIIVHAKERFALKKKHLVSAKLVHSNLFERHSQCFPLQALTNTVQAYSMLNKERLQTELLVIYGVANGKLEFHGACGAMALFQLFLENNVQDTFSETVKLLLILITTPMTMVESKRCFSILKRIKTFFK
uniref:DUF4371 domain-containing protein n=1 Tax=Latimeria chalumnae TaxID=7897 RepID=H3A095_LATCH